MAAEGATYSDPTNIQYQFSLNATVRGYHNVISVTSQSDKLDVQQNPDNSKSVSFSFKTSLENDVCFFFFIYQNIFLGAQNNRFGPFGYPNNT